MRIGWRVAAPVVAASLLASAGFGGWVWYRTGEHPSGTVPMGEAWRQDDGSTVQIERWFDTGSLLDEDDVVHRPVEGARLVVVELRFTDVTDETACRFKLVGPGQQSWSSMPLPPRLGRPSYCRAADAGPSPVVVALFEVPTDRLETVQGVQVEHPMGVRQPPVLARPA